ncbi:unnamed protein product [Closterium sp. NIES-65]|nr:unnamed protein product [Closterium sp. NIES-65]
MTHFSFAVKPSPLNSAARSRFPKSCSTGSVAYGSATSSAAALSQLASPFASPLASPFASPLASPRASSFAASAAAAGFNSPLPSVSASPLVSSTMHPSANHTRSSLPHHGDDTAVHEHDSLEASSVKSQDRMRPPTVPVAGGENVRALKPKLPPTKPSSQALGDSGATPTEAASIEYISGAESNGNSFDEFIVRRRFEVMPLDDNDEQECNLERMASQARLEAARLAVLPRDKRCSSRPPPVAFTSPSRRLHSPLPSLFPFPSRHPSLFPDRRASLFPRVALPFSLSSPSLFPPVAFPFPSRRLPISLSSPSLFPPVAFPFPSRRLPFPPPSPSLSPPVAFPFPSRRLPFALPSPSLFPPVAFPFPSRRLLFSLPSPSLFPPVAFPFPSHRLHRTLPSPSLPSPIALAPPSHRPAHSPVALSSPAHPVSPAPTLAPGSLCLSPLLILFAVSPPFPHNLFLKFSVSPTLILRSPVPPFHLPHANSLSCANVNVPITPLPFPSPLRQSSPSPTPTPLYPFASPPRKWVKQHHQRLCRKAPRLPTPALHQLRLDCHNPPPVLSLRLISFLLSLLLLFLISPHSSCSLWCLNRSSLIPPP